jgi:hypothetical protein
MEAFNERIKKTVEWMKLIGLDKSGDPLKQFLKYIEESNEIAIAESMDLKEFTPKQIMHEKKDAFGDTFVTLVLLGEMLNTPIKKQRVSFDCLIDCGEIARLENELIAHLLKSKKLSESVISILFFNYVKLAGVITGCALECFDIALEQIYKRVDSGKMINGAFVKKEDLIND